MGCFKHWIPRPSFQTRLYHLGGLFQTPLYHLGGLFQTPLYHLHPCRRASMQASLRWNDGPKSFAEHAASVKHRAVGMATDPFPPLPSFMDTPAWMQVVERRREQAAEEVLYAARGHAYRT